MKNVVILGSTGSVGKNALRVISEYPDRFKVAGLSAHSNIELLAKQTDQFKPDHVCVSDETRVEAFKEICPDKNVKIAEGLAGLNELASIKAADIVIVTLVGSAGLSPILHAIDSGKDLAIANKEPLVIAGELITRKVKEKGVRLLPLDSEHSAIFQCLDGNNDKNSIETIYLTASGGPLLNVPKSDFDSLSTEDILKHPRWNMGKKISVDSATLLNKGFEVIEASVLFDMPIDKIKVLIHPQAVIHSMVGFVNGAVMAQMSVCDMRLPIQYALTYPQKIDMSIDRLNFEKIANLNFQTPDYDRFPCLKIAYAAGKKGGSAPCVLNAADEELVKLFLGKKVKLSVFANILEKVLSDHKWNPTIDLDDIIMYEHWSKDQVRMLCT